MAHPTPATQHVSLRLGRGHVTLRVPGEATVLSGRPIPPLADPARAVRDALDQPIGAEPLADIARAKRPRSVAITISDITRPVPNALIVGQLLETLGEAGVTDDRVVVLIATGMHRPSTPEERRQMLGEALLRRVEVIDHEADRPETLVRVCDDPPVSVNRRFVQADLRIVTGLIEPHFMAGFSGGRKGICPGLVDLATVQRFHGWPVMADPRAVEGRLEGNPCHDESLRIARRVGCDFLVNVAITVDRAPAGVWAGDMVDAHRAGCAQVADWNTAELDRPFDLVLTSAGGYPLDASFYQSVKGMVTALPALHESSHLLILSDCAEIGSPEYADLMLRYGGDHRAFLDAIRAADRTAKDQWQYQMHTRVLERIGVERLLLAGDGLDRATQAKLAVTPAPGEGPAADRAQRWIDRFVAEHPGCRVAVIPEGPYTMLRGTGAATVAAEIAP